MKKAVSGIMLILLFVCMPVSAFSSKSFGVKEATSAYSSSGFSEPPATEWNKTYGGAGGDSGSSVVQTVDGGYALAGTIEPYGAGFWDMWLVKTDSSGNMQWNKTYGGTGDEVCFDMIQTSDGGYALTGWTQSYGAGLSDMWLVKLGAEPPIRGPRMDGLYIKYYGSATACYDGLKNGEVDLINWPLTLPQIDDVFSDVDIQVAMSPGTGIFQFDFNNNATTPTYRNWTNPTAYKEFRQAIACLVNKTYIVSEICNYSYRIDTPIQRPNGDWWVNWNVSQYDSYGNLLGNYPYEYNSTLAAYYLDQAGFVQSETENPFYDESFPGSAQYLRIHPETGDIMEPIIFYIRNDSSTASAPHLGRLQAGRILRDNLRKMGIPVNATEANSLTCRFKVMEEGDYHIYTGGWGLLPTISGFSLYTTEAITQDGLMANYPQFRNATYDEWVNAVLSPSSLELAREAALKCQEILIDEAVCVWLWTRSNVMGYRNIHGIVSPREWYIDNQWTFLHAYNNSRSEIHYGLRYPPDSLNVVTNYQSKTSILDCLDRIYDTLLSYCPYDKTPGNAFEYGDRGGTMPWMAEDWEIAEWESPYEPGKNLTKLIFTLRDGIRWHDGVTLNSTDIKFTIEYLKGLGEYGTYLYSSVSDVHHVITPNPRTVIIYENVSNIWTLDTIGKLPILPKHIFENIFNVTGYTPGANEGHPAYETLIGSGPWKYVYHNSSMLYLIANRDYFMETPPEAEVDFRYDWEMECWIVDAMDAAMVGEALNCSGNTIPQTKWEPGCDLDGDCLVTMADLLVVKDGFNATWGTSAKRPIVSPATNCAIYLESQQNSVLVGETLTVYVKLMNLEKLDGLQLKLNYDKTKLDYMNLSLAQIFGGDTYEMKKEIDETKGLIWISITTSGAFNQVNGNTTLATILFNATQAGGSTLDLWNTKLAKYGAPGSASQPMIHIAIDLQVIVGVPTPTGTEITVSPALNANVTFSEVTTAGNTTLNVIAQPSTAFASVYCREIKTTATYSGNITLQFAYDPTGLTLEEENATKIWLWIEDSKAWQDITTYVDTDKNTVHGTAPHL